MHWETSFPESPPESSPEPYSPSDGNHHHTIMTDCKQSLPGSLGQPLYLGHGRGLEPHTTAMTLGPSKAPPTYVGDNQKLSHHHMPTQQQQQQQQRLPMQFLPGVVMTQPHQISPPLSLNHPLPHSHPHPTLPAHMGSMPNIANQVSKKRKFSESPPNTTTAAMLHGMNSGLSIKQEPTGSQFHNYLGECSGHGPEEDYPPYDLDTNGGFMDSTYQLIKWQPFNQTKWAPLTDQDFNNLPTPDYQVAADKGFNFSVLDEAFVCQKKNHFQVTVTMQLHGLAKYVRTGESLKKIDSFYLHFYGVKKESPNQKIQIEQSQSDRSKKSFHPFKVDLPPEHVIKKTVGRLHYSETTSNNMRKKGKPNPDQRYFLLVVALHAHSGNSDYMVAANVSERIIVRASNPGQFDSDVDVMWQRGQNQDTVYHSGKVGINTDHPEEALTVHGHIRLTGALTQPSDKRAKENIEEVDPREQLETVSKLRIYKYSYTEEYADTVGIPKEDREDTGVLAQDILEVLPDAVQETGDVVLANGETIQNLLVVNKDRLFMENIGAVKELCKVTDNLEVRIDYLEQVSKQLGKKRRSDSFKSTISGSTLSEFSIQGCRMMTASLTSSLRSIRSSGKERKKDGNGSSCKVHDSTDSGGSDVSRSYDHSSMCTSSQRSSRASLVLSQPFRKLCNNRLIQVAIILLSFVLTFCVVAFTVLYLLDRDKSDGSSTQNANSEQGMANVPAGGFLNSTLNPSILKTEPPEKQTTAALSPSTTTATTTVPPFTAAPPSVSELTTSAYDGTALEPAQVAPILPPYPACYENYCEVMCCPAPHEDYIPPTVIGDGEEPPYHVIDENQTGGNNPEISWPDVVQEEEPDSSRNVDVVVNTATPKPSSNTVVVNIPMGNNQSKNRPGNNQPQYNVIAEKGGYNVVSSISNRHNMQGGYNYHRRRRGAEDAPRPVIRILELNYNLTDVFCLEDKCHNNNFTYFVHFSHYFGYEEVTIELSTPTMSYMSICSSNFMWPCPYPASRSNEVTGQAVQQTNIAQWRVAIGRNYRTKLSFHVIHPLNGHGVPLDSTACSLRSNEDYVVMMYNITFQRKC